MDQHSHRLNRRVFGKGVAAAALAASTSWPLVNISRAADKQKIRIALYTISKTWDATITSMIDAFNKTSTLANATLEFRPSDQYWDKLQTEYAAGNAPDISINQIDWVIPGAARGMFVDLNPYYEKDKIDLSDLWYDMKKEWSFDNGMFGALLYAGGQALYYNKDILDAAGEKAPAATWTWDDLLASAQRLTDASKQQFGVTLSLPNPPYWSCAFIQGAGGSVLNEAKDTCLLDSDQSKEALQWLVDLTVKHKVAPVMVQPQGSTAPNPFLTGKVGYYFGGTWDESALHTSGFNWNFLPMPAHPTTKLRSVQLGSNAWSMLSTTKHKDAAWEVINYLGGPKGAANVESLGIPGYTSVVDSDAFKKVHLPGDISIPINDFRQVGHDYYPTEDANEWWNAVTQEFGPMWTGDDTVENSTKRATDAVNAIFAKRGTF